MSEARCVLVTGASGFVGRALLDALVARPGVVVTAAVRRETALQAGVRVCRPGEIGPGTDWSDALAGCDAVAHLAARVHMMRDGSADPLAECRRVNVIGTLALARQAAAAGVRRFVFVSSIKVNGESTRRGAAFSETDPPAPIDPYGISKAEAEAGLRDVASSTGMEVVVIRPPLVHGPGVKANFLTMTRWLARGLPLPLGAIHDNRRSLVGLDNLVDLIITCLHHPAAANEVFLAGDGEDVSTTDLIRRTAAALGVRARLIPVPIPILAAGARLLGRRDVVQRLCGSLQVDISKARRLLGWSPPVTLDEGLRRAVRPLVPMRIAS
jgi:nucleoside-diphosphate-sugar epimerase